MATPSVHTIGRRKTAVARIYMQPGSGLITINTRTIEEYFPSEILRTIIHQPLTLLEELGKYDFRVNVKGGGFTGQAEAIRLAIARALVEHNGPEVKPALRKEGFMTRDARMVERKKPGRRKARRKFQFSKR